MGERQPLISLGQTYLLVSFLSPTLLWVYCSLLSSHFAVEKQQGQPFPYDDWNGTPRMKMAGLPSL